MSKNTSGVTRKAKVFTTTPVRIIAKHASIWAIVGLVVGLIVSVCLGLGLHNKIMPTASVDFAAHTASNEGSTGNAIKVIDTKGIKFEYVGTYEPNKVHEAKIKGDLPEGVEVEYYNNKHTNAGTYKAVAVLYGEGYEPLVLETDMVINKAEIKGISFDNKNIFEYKAGNTYSVHINGTLPGNPGELTVGYEGNNITTSGEHKVSVTISGPNYETFTLDTTVYVIDLRAGVSFPSLEDRTFTYDGTAHSVELDTSKVPAYVKNLPGYKVTHTTNQYTNAGTHSVTATISADGFESVSLTTDMIINKLALNDVDGFGVNVGSCVYDENPHGVSLNNLPEGIEPKVTYYLGEKEVLPENVINPGSYRVVIEFTDNTNNYTVENIEKTLTIEKREFSSVFKFKNTTYSYRLDNDDQPIERTIKLSWDEEKIIEIFGEEHTLEIVYYYNGEEFTEAPVFTEAGVYVIKVVITGNEYYKNAELEATLTIEHATLNENVEASTLQIGWVRSFLNGESARPSYKIDFSSLHDLKNFDDDDITVEYYVKGQKVEEIEHIGIYDVQIRIYAGNYETVKNVKYIALPCPFIILLCVVAFAIIGALIGIIISIVNGTREDFSESHFLAPSAAVAKVREGVICESYAKYHKTGKQGRLYLSKQTLEFYSDNYKDAKNNLLINVVDIRNVNVLSASKIQVFANHEEHIFTVPGGRAADWVDEIVRM